MSAELDLVYRLVKELKKIRNKLPEWARAYRTEQFGKAQEIEMMQKALEIDKLLRFLSVDWIDEEDNSK